MGPRDLQSTTRYLNRTRLRTWDPFVVVKIDGKEVRGWIPKSEEEDRSFKNLLSARMGLGSGWMMDTKGGLEALQVRLEAAGEVMGTTTATRNKNKFKILDDIRKMATEAAKCRNPIQENTKSSKAIWCQCGCHVPQVRLCRDLL